MRILPISIFILIILAGGWMFFRSGWREKSFIEVIIDGHKIKAEAARSIDEKARGLSGREDLKEGEGMLFFFDSLQKPSFHMRGMNFPIDIVWINGDKIVDISPDLPPSKGLDITLYRPKENVDRVLEINAGTAERQGYTIGDRIETKEL